MENLYHTKIKNKFVWEKLKDWKELFFYLRKSKHWEEQKLKLMDAKEHSFQPKSYHFHFMVCDGNKWLS